MKPVRCVDLAGFDSQAQQKEKTLKSPEIICLLKKDLLSLPLSCNHEREAWRWDAAKDAGAPDSVSSVWTVEVFFLFFFPSLFMRHCAREQAEPPTPANPPYLHPPTCHLPPPHADNESFGVEAPLVVMAAGLSALSLVN